MKRRVGERDMSSRTRRGANSSSGDDTMTPTRQTRSGSSGSGGGSGGGTGAAADIDISNYMEEDHNLDGNIGDIPLVETDGNLDEIDTNSLFRSGGPPVPKAFQNPPGSTPLDKREIRKQYAELISYCQEQENQKEFDSNLQSLMTKNITEGGKLFNQIGESPGAMQLAFYHTCMVSEVIKYKTMSIGNNTSNFKMDLFLNSLMGQCRDTDNQYNNVQAIKNLSRSAAECGQTAPYFTTVIGTFDSEGISGPPKEKKERAPRRKAFDEELAQATQHEEVRITEAERTTKNKTNADNFSREILSLLKTRVVRKPDSGLNIFEFIWDKESYANTIEYLFYIAFLIRDGDLRLYKERGHGSRDKSGKATLAIKPDERPKKQVEKKHEKDQHPRRQYILSFSAKQWREMNPYVSGENIITDHKNHLLRENENANKKRR